MHAGEAPTSKEPPESHVPDNAPVPEPPFPSRHVLGMRVDASTYVTAANRIVSWAMPGDVELAAPTSPRPRYVCVANVHMTMEAFDDPSFRDLVNRADLVTSDGMPLVWMLKRLGLRQAERVYGPTLTLHVCEAAAAAGVPVGFYGGAQEAVEGLQAELARRFPDLDVRYAYSPPFRPLTEEEDDQIVADILASGTRILFVGLGCPKQERWMAAHAKRLPVVQLGVGAAFDFHAGRVKQAPAWMQDRGLEWLFRLAVEPRRLWRRYLVHNPRFVFFAGLQLLGVGWGRD
ncbi:MAG: WecB/TagA/CpsF family glycosyltransferase [Trueperaceae bacterium]